MSWCQESSNHYFIFNNFGIFNFLFILISVIATDIRCFKRKVTIYSYLEFTNWICLSTFVGIRICYVRDRSTSSLITNSKIRCWALQNLLLSLLLLLLFKFKTFQHCRKSNNAVLFSFRKNIHLNYFECGTFFFQFLKHFLIFLRKTF